MIATVVISAILFAIVAAIIRKLYKDHTEGRTSCGCGCGCGGCPGASACHPKK